jgi:type IV pilus assembly protein PilW
MGWFNLAITVQRDLYGERDMLRDFINRGKANIPVRREDGFSIVELLVAMAISLLVLASVYSVFRSQQKSTVVREQVNMMQQNLRAGMTVMTRDIRMVGYVHPVYEAAMAAIAPGTDGFTVAEPDELTFTRLKDDPPAVVARETIKYNLTDFDGDGDNDLVRVIDGGTPQLIAEDIDALDFVYLDENNDVIADPPNNLGLIRSVQVTMVARTGRGDQGYVDNNTYENQQNVALNMSNNPPNDSFRRRILSREILCRNLF